MDNRVVTILRLNEGESRACRDALHDWLGFCKDNYPTPTVQMVQQVIDLLDSPMRGRIESVYETVKEDLDKARRINNG